MLLELLAVLLCSGSSQPVSSSRTTHAASGCSFEEADSYFDKNGDEHIVDYEDYCEECDDYHEEGDFE